jgi:hypothetical protein
MDASNGVYLLIAAFSLALGNYVAEAMLLALKIAAILR